MFLIRRFRLSKSAHQEAASAEYKPALRKNDQPPHDFFWQCCWRPVSGAEMYARVAEANGVARKDMTLIEMPAIRKRKCTRQSAVSGTLLRARYLHHICPEP